MYLIKQGIVPIKITRAKESAGTQWIEVSWCTRYMVNIRVAVERSNYENHNTDVK
jgi:hypothetical protein